MVWALCMLNMNRNLDTFKEGEDHVKVSHFTKKGLNIEGIIHVGTNDWYEYEYYKKMGIQNIIGFEPYHEAVVRFREKYPEGCLYEVALGDEIGTYRFNIASGDGQSSSFLEMTGEYKEEFPDIKIVDTQDIKVISFKKWIKTHKKVRLDYFDCLVVDVEGMELDVLKGFGEYLNGFKMLNIECSGVPTYIQGPLADEIIEYLSLYGFKQDSPVEPHNDVFFIKE